MAERKSTAEWRTIEDEYCFGDDSIREIADRNAISEAAIRKRAKKDGWKRPVRTATKRREPVRQPPAPPPVDPTKPLDVAQLADDGRGLLKRMLEELDVTTSRRGELEDMICEATDGDEADSRRDAMFKAITLPVRASTLRTLSAALKNFNETAAPALGKKEATQQRAEESANRFRPMGPPRLSSVK